MSSITTDQQKETASQQAPGMTMAQRRAIGRTWRIVVIVIAIVYALFPVIYIISASFNPANSLSTSAIIPRNPSLEHYRTLFERDFWLWIRNSFVVATL
ncbi:MAG: sugar ABC transporter permease, partial [Chloroflexota bacterium]